MRIGIMALAACGLLSAGAAEAQTKYYARAIVSPKSAAPPSASWTMGAWTQTTACLDYGGGRRAANWRRDPSCTLGGVDVAASQCTGTAPDPEQESRTCAPTRCAAFEQKNVDIVDSSYAKGYGFGYSPSPSSLSDLASQCEQDGARACVLTRGNNYALSYFGSASKEQASGNSRMIAYCS